MRATAVKTVSVLSLATYLAIAAYAGWLAIRLQPAMLIDDAAITFRYATRLAAGRGFTYNDDERVLGASNPLYTLVLAASAAAGGDVETTARALAVLLLVAVSLEAAALGEAISGSPVGRLAGLLLPTDYFFRYQGLSGMESSIAVFLGLAAVLAMLREREAIAGLFLGLALWNKLDAGLLGVAIAFAWIIARHRLPFRIAWISGLVVTPWIVFAWLYFGSPIPHSFIAKLGHGAAHPVDHQWIDLFFQGEHRRFLCVVALGSVAAWRYMSDGVRAATLALVGWFAAHATVFSFVSLGDTYPWYLTVLTPPPIILASTVPGLVFRVLRRGIVAGVAATVAVGGLVWSLSLSAQATRRDLTDRDLINPWEAFDADRRLAGVFLRQYADPHEIVDSGFGWTSFEIPNPVNDPSGLNTVTARTPVSYAVVPGVPRSSGYRAPQGPAGFVPLATFNLASEMFPENTWFVVYGAPASRIARLGPRRVQWTLSELESPGGSTYVVTNAGQPVTIIFTPAFDRAVVDNSAAEAYFEVWREQTRGFTRLVRADDHVDQMAIRLSDGSSTDRTAFSLLTRPTERSTGTITGASWRNVRIVVGDAPLDVEELRDLRLIQAWRRHNPDASVGPR